MLNITGIYSIFNIITQKYYIGQSIDIYRRFSIHKRELNTNRHVNRHLQSSWNKYGESNFRFFVVEECSSDLLNEREIFWIKSFDSFRNGYNLDEGGDGIHGYKHTASEISKMRKIQNPLVVLQFDLEHNLICRFEGGISHAAKELHYTKECIKRCCEHTGNKISYKDYYWVFEKEYIDNRFSWVAYESQIKFIDLAPRKKKQIQKICQYDRDRNLIKTWNSFSEIEAAGFNRAQVNSICNKRKGKKTHKGYIWVFEGYDFSDSYFDSLDTHFNKAIQEKKQPILQYSKNGVVINEFDSIANAVSNLKIGRNTLINAIDNHLIIFDSLLSYKKNDWVPSKISQLEECTKLENNSTRKIIRYDDIGNVKHFSSISSAAREMNFPIGSIHRAIVNGKEYKGYLWKYEK